MEARHHTLSEVVVAGCTWYLGPSLGRASERGWRPVKIGAHLKSSEIRGLVSICPNPWEVRHNEEGDSEDRQNPEPKRKAGLTDKQKRY